MNPDARDEHEELAERSMRLLSHLDGALDASMLDAIQGAWSMLERTATDAPAHARAVRSRLFWESLAPGESRAAASSTLVTGLMPTWDDEPGDDAAEAA